MSKKERHDSPQTLWKHVHAEYERIIKEERLQQGMPPRELVKLGVSSDAGDIRLMLESLVFTRNTPDTIRKQMEHKLAEAVGAISEAIKIGEDGLAIERAMQCMEDDGCPSARQAASLLQSATLRREMVADILLHKRQSQIEQTAAEEAARRHLGREDDDAPMPTDDERTKKRRLMLVEAVLGQWVRRNKNVLERKTFEEIKEYAIVRLPADLTGSFQDYILNKVLAEHKVSVKPATPPPSQIIDKLSQDIEAELEEVSGDPEQQEVDAKFEVMEKHENPEENSNA